MKETVSYTIALAGNPNVGKSTLFNNLTGMHQHTGNWPGKTVELAKGTSRCGNIRLEIVDLPGAYSLDGDTEDQKIAGEYMQSQKASCTVVVCDGSCLERNLILALQVLQITSRAVLCVNLIDEATRRGVSVDKELLSQKLGIPVVLTAAGKKQGMEELKQMIIDVCRAQPPEKKQWIDPIEQARQIAEACTSVDTKKNENWRLVLDRILTGRRHGIPILCMLLFLIVWLTVWGANYPSALLERLFDWGYTGLKSLFAWAPWWLSGVLIDGMYTTAGRVICVMLPPMAIFFPLFTLLEDIGYLPRMAFLLDHGMHRCGGCGKQALTMCMGLGCNAVGVTGCRIIDSPRERTAAILTNAMIPCNGRFPALIILGSMFFSGASSAVIVASCVALGMAGAMAVSGVLYKTALKGEDSTFVMEMPPFRCPRLGQIVVRSIIDRTVQVALRALYVAVPAGAVRWILANTGTLSRLASIMNPLGVLLGMNGAILVAFVFSLPANELLLPVLIMVLTGAENLQNAAMIGNEVLQCAMVWQTAVCTMVFTLFHWPCATTLLTVYKETGSMKKTAAAFALPTAVGIALCFLLKIILY